MRKVYMVRHQKGGVDYRQAFQAYPSEAQMAPIVADLNRRLGEAKTWVHEMDLYEDEVPSFDRTSSGLTVVMRGTGTVEPPK